METEVKPTIASLWDRFQKLGNYIETEKFLQSWGTKGSDGLSHDGRDHSVDEIELQSLYQQLLERCKIFRGHFDKLENRIRFGITVFQTETVSMTTPEGHGMPLNANDLMELSAICAFWAWEIDKRKKEASI